MVPRSESPTRAPQDEGSLDMAAAESSALRHSIGRRTRGSWTFKSIPYGFERVGEGSPTRAPQDEGFLDMATAISGSGPAYLYMTMEAMIDAGVHMGFPRHAHARARARLAYQPPIHPPTHTHPPILSLSHTTTTTTTTRRAAGVTKLPGLGPLCRRGQSSRTAGTGDSDMGLGCATRMWDSDRDGASRQRENGVRVCVCVCVCV